MLQPTLLTYKLLVLLCLFFAGGCIISVFDLSPCPYKMAYTWMGIVLVIVGCTLLFLVLP